jgi:uncharacterized protein YbjQ (UPF0145 family)
VLVPGDATAPVTVLGPVSAEHHQKSMFSKTDARSELDKQLRAAAARLGADAVINVDYDMNSPLMSKKGQLARGTAVKFNAQPVAAAPVQVAAAPAPVAPPVAAPVIAAPAPVATPPVVAVPVAPPAAAPTPAKPVANTAATMTAIALAEGDAPGGRAYAVLGAINANARPQLDKAPKQVLDEDLRAKAGAMGADAVIMIKYDASGAFATGVAVKYK